MQDSTVREPRAVTAAGIGLLAVIGVIHYVYAPGYYAFVPYLGALFYATVAGAVLAGVGLLCGARKWGWMLGMLLAAGALGGYVVSRTIGLPLLPVLPWQDPFGLASVVAEALFIGLGWIVLRAAPHAALLDARSMAMEPGQTRP